MPSGRVMHTKQNNTADTGYRSASSASTSIDGSAAGDIWDTFDGARGAVTAVAVSDSATGNNSVFYTLPTLMDGLSINASYKPQASSRVSGSGYGVAYTGIEGLTVGYATGELHESTTESIDHSTYFIKYAYGNFTVAYQDHEADGTSAASSDESETWGVSYAVNEDFTIAYGERDYDDNTSSAAAGSLEQNDSGFSASYTTGGMTITATMKDGENINHTSAANEDMEYWSLGASFAF